MHNRWRISYVIGLAVALTGMVFLAAEAADPAVTIEVNGVADDLTAGDGTCTLREAINNANADSDTTGGDCAAGSGADTIALPAGTYTLTISGPDEDDNATGDLDVLDSLTIDGAGAETTLIDGNQLDRVVHVQGQLTQVTLNGLAVAHGLWVDGGGGGILNELADLVLQNCVVRDNKADGGDGGGILNLEGSLTLDNTIVRDNEVTALFLWGGGGVASGGYVADASLTLVDSQVLNNTAPAGGGGILDFVGGPLTGTLTISNSTVSGNVVGGGGGGIQTANLGMAGSHRVMIDSSTIADNRADGTAAVSGYGGGLYAYGAELSIDATTIVSNTASSTGSPGGFGGGLVLWNSVATVANSTVSGNAATGNANVDNGGGGGLALITDSGFGGAYTLTNTTIANNSADEAGGGLWAGEVVGGADFTVTFANVLVAQNLAPTGQGSNCFAGYGPPEFVSLGHNLEDDDTCQFDQASDQVNTDSLLGPLQDNGGPTWTHPLLEGSPAIDAADDAVCAAPPVNGVDQRGVARPQGAACDIGAFEAEEPLVAVHHLYLPIGMTP